VRIFVSVAVVGASYWGKNLVHNFAGGGVSKVIVSTHSI